jgi:hypothetical protein
VRGLSIAVEETVAARLKSYGMPVAWLKVEMRALLKTLDFEKGKNALYFRGRREVLQSIVNDPPLLVLTILQL